MVLIRERFPRGCCGRIHLSEARKERTQQFQRQRSASFFEVPKRFKEDTQLQERSDRKRQPHSVTAQKRVIPCAMLGTPVAQDKAIMRVAESQEATSSGAGGGSGPSVRVSLLPSCTPCSIEEGDTSPLLRDTSTYRYLIDKVVDGSTERSPADSLPGTSTRSGARRDGGRARSSPRAHSGRMCNDNG